MPHFAQVPDRCIYRKLVPSPAHHLPDRSRIAPASLHGFTEFLHHPFRLPLLGILALCPLADPLWGTLGQGDVARLELLSRRRARAPPPTLVCELVWGFSPTPLRARRRARDRRRGYPGPRGPTPSERWFRSARAHLRRASRVISKNSSFTCWCAHGCGMRPARRRRRILTESFELWTRRVTRLLHPRSKGERVRTEASRRVLSH